MLQKLPIALALVKAGNTYVNYYICEIYTIILYICKIPQIKSDKFHILCIEEKKLLKT